MSFGNVARRKWLVINMQEEEAYTKPQRGIFFHHPFRVLNDTAVKFSPPPILEYIVLLAYIILCKGGQRSPHIFV